MQKVANERILGTCNRIWPAVRDFRFNPFLGACVNFMVIIRIYVRVTLRVFRRKFAKTLFVLRLIDVYIQFLRTVRCIYVYSLTITVMMKIIMTTMGIYNKPFLERFVCEKRDWTSV